MKLLKLGELTWGEYTKRVSGRILRLVRRIIEKQREGLEKFLESPEFGALSKDSQVKFRKEVGNLYKIVEMLRDSNLVRESVSLDISALDPESESKIKGAISEAVRRLLPMDQKGILETLQPKEEAKSHPEISEEKIDELLHSGKMPGIQDNILKILSLLHYEIHKIRVSAEAIPKELHELRMLFVRLESKGEFK